jgi:phosphatidylserine/phosphatidylglycerophosphate/cardiolipin synthase-like enzyme
MKSKSLVFLLLSLCNACSTPNPDLAVDSASGPASEDDSADQSGPAWMSRLKLQGSLSLFSTPGATGHQPWIDAIHNATQSIQLTMFHLTDPDVVNELLGKASLPDLRVILDGATLKTAKYARIFKQLKDAGVQIKGSSSAFDMTHTKAMVVDGKRAFVTSMNLTKTFDTTRDFGLITEDADVIAEMQAVFETDWKNADSGAGDTPALSDRNLVWSPINAEPKLVDLISSAKKTVVLTVENLGDAAIQNALVTVATRKDAPVAVRVIVPECDENPDPLINYPHLKMLTDNQVQGRVMPHPSTADAPYMHSKMILVDDRVAYDGSVNYSIHSTRSNRELGIVWRVMDTLKVLLDSFVTDWTAARDVPAVLPTDCPML